MSAAPSTVPPEIAEQVEEFKKVQSEIQGYIKTQTQLSSQHHENTLVKEEFELLKEGTDVFKKVGPVLVKQELAEAKSDVQHRLDFISGELARTEEKLRAAQAKQEGIRDKIQQLQKEFEARAKAAAEGS